MRHGLLAFAALVSTASIATPPAEACGPYAPTVLLVSSHVGVDKGFASSYAVLDEKVPTTLRTWTQLAPRTYDGTLIAPGSAFGPAVPLSLVGTAGATSFSATDRFYLRHTFARGDAHAVLALPAGDFRVAIVGAHDDKARFLELGSRTQTSGDAIWVAQQHLNAYNARIEIAPIQGTAFEVVTVTARDTGKTTSLIRSGADVYEQTDGRVVGGLMFRGTAFALVLENNKLSARSL